MLFARIAEGDDVAYKQAFDRYFDPLKWYAYKLLNSEFWAEEVVQEVFVQLWTKRSQLSSLEAPQAYLYRMARNRCFDRIRRQRLEVEMEYLVSTVLHGTAHSYQQGRYDIQQFEAYIREAVDTLPEQGKKIYQLQQEEGLSYQEIADQLQISRHTVRNHMAKTLQTIRAYLLNKGLLWVLLFNTWHLGENFLQGARISCSL